jgi:hypothetical protein
VSGERKRPLGWITVALEREPEDGAQDTAHAYNPFLRRTVCGHDAPVLTDHLWPSFIEAWENQPFLQPLTRCELCQAEIARRSGKRE